jgi:hypothetical protein
MGRGIALEELDRTGAFSFGGAMHGPDAATVRAGADAFSAVNQWERASPVSRSPNHPTSRRYGRMFLTRCRP